MRLSRAFMPTLKEVPADAQVASHIFLIRGGFMRRLAAGIYSFLPLGWRVLQKIEGIIRDEMNRAGAQEVLMPAAIPAELWQESERWEKYGPELLRFTDRKGAAFCFGPTHEEVITDLVRNDLKSYRDLPQNLYQIQSKFRDEMRPRAGLLRGREFIMKDAYSFDVSVEAAERSYKNMYATYERIFSRAGLAFRVVEADTGAIGGSMSHEFQVLAESGEDTLVACNACAYAANVEQAEVVPAVERGEGGTLEKVATPGKKTIEEVAGFLGQPPARLVKTLIYMADKKPVAILCRGDRAVNEIAVKKVTGASEVYLASDAQVKEATGAVTGFAGPVGLDIPIYADRELEGATGMIAGANEADFHVTGLDLARDAKVTAYAGLRLAEAGDKCPRCDSGRFEVLRGIEVGHVFLLGTRYSRPMKCLFLDEDGTQKPMIMGCYGIGITRIMAAAIEQNHDKDGIIWPLAIAPYEVEVVPLGADEEVLRAADEIYGALSDRGIEVLLDDRDERPGAKLKDADLIGVPLRVVIGKRSIKDGEIEVKWRRESEAKRVPLADCAGAIAAMLAEARS